MVGKDLVQLVDNLLCVVFVAWRYLTSSSSVHVSINSGGYEGETSREDTDGVRAVPTHQGPRLEVLVGVN